MAAARLSLLYTVLFVWILIFIVHYTMGPKGMMYGRILRENNEQLEIEIKRMKDEIISLKEQQERWHREPFLKEQLAREQLQLAYPGDTVYYIN